MGTEAAPDETNREPSTPGTVELHYVPPGCVGGSGYYNVTSPAVFFEHFGENEGAASSPGIGEGLLYDGRRWLIPFGDLNRYQLARELISNPESFDRVVLHYDLPVMVGTQELVFQYPIDNGRDWLKLLEPQAGDRGAYPTLRRELMRLVLYRGPKRRRVLALEPITMPDGEPLSTDLLAYSPSLGVRLQLSSPDGDSSVYTIGRLGMRGSRTVAELERMKRSSGERLLLHAGSVVRRFAPKPFQDFCADVLTGLGPAAVVPGTGDLGLGALELAAFQERHDIPYVAANLKVAGSDDRPFPPFVVETINGLTVAVIGVVTEDETQALPVPVREEWTVEDPARALERAVDEVHDTLGHRPDLTVLLADGLSTGMWRGVRGIDVAVASFSNPDDRFFSTVTELRERPEGVTDASRFEVPALAVLAERNSVGRIRAQFESRGAERPLRLYRLEHDSFSVLEDGDRDQTVETTLRGLEEDRLAVNAEIVLADPASAVESDESLRDLVYGEQVLRGDRYVPYGEVFPPVFSDALWMRLVTNTMLLKLEAEVALSRNLERNAQTVGR
ncbi:MAG: hypothetical protein AAFY60_05180, partial [Myxococcota bacterium]